MMKPILKLLFAILFTACNLTVFAQQSSNIKGTVTTSDGKPAPYVTIGLTGSSKGTTTGSDGSYQINRIKPGTYLIKISSIGLASQEHQLTLKNGETVTADFTLEENAQQLSEVVIKTNRNRGFASKQVSPSLRLQTPLVEAPQSLTVINSEVLQSQQVYNIGENLERNSSGIYKNGNGSYSNTYADIAIRGTRSGNSQLVDGLKLGMDQAITSTLFDAAIIDRLEYVKGPAGFMLANTDAGGFYNIVTKKPTGNNRGSISISYASFNTLRATADIDQRLTSDGKLALRVNGAYQTGNTIRDNDYLNKATFAPVLQFKPDSNTTATVQYIYSYSSYFEMRRSSYGINSFEEAPMNLALADPVLFPNKTNQHNIIANFEHKLSSQWKITAQLGYQAEKANINWFDVDHATPNGDLYRYLTLDSYRYQGKMGQVFVSGQVNTGPVRHRILAGFDASSKRYASNYDFPDTAMHILNIYDQKHNLTKADLPNYADRFYHPENYYNYQPMYSYESTYIQDELGFGNLRVTLGGRYTTSKVNEPFTTLAVYRSYMFTPRVGVCYLVTPNTSVYGVYDRSFNEQVGSTFDGQRYKPLISRNLEFGAKRNWMDGNLVTSLALYRITQQNALTSDPLHQNFSIQTGEILNKGIEFDIVGKLTKDLDVVINGTINDNRITKDNNVDNIGKKTPITAGQMYNTWLTYHVRSSNVNGLSISAGGKHVRDRYTFDLSPTPNKNFKLPNLTQIDAAANYTKEAISLSLVVNNVLNAKNYSGYRFTTYGYYQTFYDDPTNFRLNVAYRF